MCGVAFLLAPELSVDERRWRIQRALALLQHRGPDNGGIHTGTDFACGHRRLSIIDLHGGRQPMCDPSRRWVLAFNGEIYNFQQLRAQLAWRWPFRDASDTEVLLAGLVLEGPEFVRRLDGMWAFVLHDTHRGWTLLSRDRLGKKPLFYARTDGAFACASELPALRRLLPEADWGEDAQSIGDYFRYGFPLPGYTCFCGVREVRPGHSLIRSAGGELSENRHWWPTAVAWRGTVAQAANEIRDRLTHAVRRRQVAADVEVGAFLSGGVDSSIVCALACIAAGGSLRTFTAGFQEESYDERAPAARVAAALGTVHTAEVLSFAQAQAFAENLPAHLGQPFGDASLVPSAMIASVAARRVKVVLTGDGGDEVFGGYARYVARLLQQHYSRLPASARRIFERYVLATREPLAHHSGSLLKRLHLFVRMVREPRSAYLAPPAIRAQTLARLVPVLPAGHDPPLVPWPEDPDELRQMMLTDWLIWLPQDILPKLDRATMMHSLEARCPFLDVDLLEFVMGLPWSWHFQRLRGKRLLREAMLGVIPDFVWRRRKQGFAAPTAHWFRGALGDRLLELAQDRDCGVVAAEGLRSLVGEHRAGFRNHDQALWMAYVYLQWRRGETAHG